MQGNLQMMASTYQENVRSRQEERERRRLAEQRRQLQLELSANHRIVEHKRERICILRKEIRAAEERETEDSLETPAKDKRAQLKKLKTEIKEIESSNEVIRAELNRTRPEPAVAAAAASARNHLVSPVLNTGTTLEAAGSNDE